MEVKNMMTKDPRLNQKHFINTKLVEIMEYDNHGSSM